MTQSVHVVCSACGTVNRVPQDRLASGGRCGRCRETLLKDTPASVDGETLARHLQRDDLPLVVDFWAPWCGPCKMFAPVFEQSARRFAGRARFLKLDTQAYPEAAARFGIRSIPTLGLFQGGKEVTRQAGAMDATTFQRWLSERVG
jgi:thioredoxin 2